MAACRVDLCSWVAAQYSMALSCVYLEPASDAGAPYSAAARIGPRAVHLYTLLLYTIHTPGRVGGDARSADGVRIRCTASCMLLGLCCRLHCTRLQTCGWRSSNPSSDRVSGNSCQRPPHRSRETRAVSVRLFFPLGIAPPASATAAAPRGEASLIMACADSSQSGISEASTRDQSRERSEHNRRSNNANRRDSDRRRSQKKHSMLAMKYVQLAWGVQSVKKRAWTVIISTRARATYDVFFDLSGCRYRAEPSHYSRCLPVLVASLLRLAIGWSYLSYGRWMR